MRDSVATASALPAQSRIDRTLGNGEEELVAFVQVIDFRTSRFEELLAERVRWVTTTEGRRTMRRTVLCQDRTDPDHYVNIVFFDSDESARVNSNLPETQRLAQTLNAVSDGEPRFCDLDVIDDRS